MSKLAILDHEGRVLVDAKPTPPSQADTTEEPLYLVAARQHTKDSTQNDTNK